MGRSVRTPRRSAYVVLKALDSGVASRFISWILRRESWFAPAAMLVTTILLSWRVLASPSQFAINDLGPFGSQMLLSCALTYDQTGLGRTDLHTIPSHCDFGLLAVVLGPVNAQHLFLIGCFGVAGLSMFYLLRRIGYSAAVSILGGLVYEFAPVMLSWQLSGEGLLVTAALLPAILLGAIPTPNRSFLVDGCRSGAFLALACYANPQAPTLAVILVVPAVAAELIRDSKSDRIGTFYFLLSFGIAFTVAAIPVLQILPGFGSMIQGMHVEIQSDLLTRINGNSVADFLAPYLVVGFVPALVGILLLADGKSHHTAELAATVSLASVFVLWEGLHDLGPRIAPTFPLISLYKDFVKLQLLLSVPVVVLSMSCLTWALHLRFRWLRAVGTYAAVALVLAPVLLGSPLNPVYGKQGSPTPNVEALAAGDLGFPSWSKVPSAYTGVLDQLRARDPNTASYRVLWMPIDWRLLQFSRASDSNLLLVHLEDADASRNAIQQLFTAIVAGDEQPIAAMLADMGVKYVVLDTADGQDRNVESWQTGPRNLEDFWNSLVLAGRPTDYRAVLDGAPGLSVVLQSAGWLVFRNLDWRPILMSYQGVLKVPANLPTLASLAEGPTEHPELLLSLWRELPDLLVERVPSDSAPLSSQEIPAMSLVYSAAAPYRSDAIDLLTSADVRLDGQWSASSVPNALGIERFSGGSGAIRIRPGLTASMPTGTRIVWLEYPPNATDPSQGSVMSRPGSPGDPSVACAVPGCTIANLMVVPPIPSAAPIARLGYSPSSHLRTSDGKRTPIRVAQDWASIFSPAPHGYPSALNDPATVVRAAGVLIGHIALLIGLLIGMFRRT